jgi:hypothetical protein
MQHRAAYGWGSDVRSSTQPFTTTWLHQHCHHQIVIMETCQCRWLAEAMINPSPPAGASSCGSAYLQRSF